MTKQCKQIDITICDFLTVILSNNEKSYKFIKTLINLIRMRMKNKMFGYEKEEIVSEILNSVSH
jgi:hypothetical protein